MFDMNKFATYLSAKRKNAGLTQEQFADLVGVSHQAVSKWERGETFPEISKIGDIAKALNVAADEVLAEVYGKYGDGSQSEQSKTNADDEYYKLHDKTSVGDIYRLAPNLSPETLNSAISLIVDVKGAKAAKLLYKYADREFLAALGLKLLEKGDYELCHYVAEEELEAAIVTIVANADSQGDWSDKKQNNYFQAGVLLTNCVNIEFVNDMFEHIVGQLGVWDVFKPIITAFPQEVLVKQGALFMVGHRLDSFGVWWDILGKRTMARMFLAYADLMDNSTSAWSDIVRRHYVADSSIMFAGIKERIDSIDAKVFLPILQNRNVYNDELYEILKDKLPEHNFSNKNGIHININKNRGRSRISLFGDDNPLEELLERISELEERIDEFEGQIDEFDGRIDELDGRIDELDGRIDDLEE